MAENSNAADSILRLSKGDAYKIKVEEPSEMDSSPFREVYIKALRALEEILSDNMPNGHQGSKSSGTMPPQRRKEINPVIGFCGERGSGKTSGMVSFRNLLDSWHALDDDTQRQSLYKQFILPIKEAHFVCLEPVDPSRFEPHDRLIGSILGELYRKFDKYLENKDHKTNERQQRNVEEAFKDVLEVVQLLSNDKAMPFGTPGAGENHFEILKRAGKAADARELMHNLVVELLKLLGGTSTNVTPYLVIPVDDLDMSVQHAYQLAEDIRKYFMIPNVIILVAAKVDQLRMAVEQSYVERFRDYRRELQKPTQAEIESMSNLYLEKLIPLGRRIPMPDFSWVEVSQNTQLSWEGNNKGKIEDFILEIVKSKTRLIFKAKQGKIHPIIPRTLREIHNFLNWMEGTNESTGLSQFKLYLFSEWIPRNFQRKEEEILQKIHEASPEDQNWVIVQTLSHWLRINPDVISLNEGGFHFQSFNEHQNWLERTLKSELDEILSIADRTRPKYQVSIGDVRYLLNIVEKLTGEKEGSKLTFAIKTIISIDLLESFELLFRNNEGTFDSEDRLERLINGSFTHPLMLGMFSPNNFTSLHTSSSLKNTRKTLRFTVGGSIGKDPQKSLAPIRLSTICDDLAKSNGFPIDPNPVFWLVSQIMYFGKIQESLSGRRALTKWYNMLGSLFDEGPNASYLSFDFWAFLFWVFLPTKSIERVSRKANSNKNLDGQGSLFGDNYPKDFAKLVLSNQKNFWASIIQLEIIESIQEWMQDRFIADQKNQKFKGKYLPSFFFGWVIRHFYYACTEILPWEIETPFYHSIFSSNMEETSISDDELIALKLNPRNLRELREVIDRYCSSNPHDLKEIIKARYNGRFFDWLDILKNWKPKSLLNTAISALEQFEQEVQSASLYEQFPTNKEIISHLRRQKESILGLRNNSENKKYISVIASVFKELKKFEPRLGDDINWEEVDSMVQSLNAMNSDANSRSEIETTVISTIEEMILILEQESKTSIDEGDEQAPSAEDENVVNKNK